MMARSPTPEEVRALWQHLSEHYHSAFITHPSPRERRTLKRVLTRIGVRHLEAFLQSFTVTLGRRIYLPFEVGVPQKRWTLWRQIVAAACAHQCIAQMDAQCAVEYFRRYTASPIQRAQITAQAYTCELELTYWRTGRLPNTDQIAGRLKHVGCEGPEITMASLCLDVAAKRILIDHHLITEVGQRTVAWLNTHAPHLGFAERGYPFKEKP